MNTKNSVLTVLIIAVFLFLNLGLSNASASPTLAQTQSTILFVKPGEEGDCFSWDTACDLQNALTLAETGDQAWVAAGTYKPITDTDRTATFLLESGVAIYGGFAGTETSLEERDWETNLTTLSGDIGTEAVNTDNSYHVVTGTGVDETAILDGFTISDGNASAEPVPHIYGGGMYISDGNPTLNNLIFHANTANYGGGMYNSGGNPTLTNVIFSANTTWENGTGGGMYNSQCSPALTNVTFSENMSLYGGGMYNNHSTPTLTNTTFQENEAYFYNYGRGGGIYNDYSSPMIVNSTFSANTARYGGGIYNVNSSSPTLTNVTFTGNNADLSYTNGGGMHNNSGSNPTIRNAIFWGNVPDQISGPATITYSDIEGGWEGNGNLSEDPLLGPAAYNGGFTQTHELGEGSPAIDAGDPLSCPDTDQRGVPRPIDGDGDDDAVCDMGAYEYVPQVFIYLPLIVR